MTKQDQWNVTRRSALIALAGGAVTVGSMTRAEADPTSASDEPVHLAEAPMPPDAQGVSAIAVDTSSADAGVVRAAWTSAPFELVGLTWLGGSARIRASVRVRSDSRWGEWTPLVDDDHGNTEERAGTAPLWVSDADALEFYAESVDGSTFPDELSVALIHPSPDTVSLGPADAQRAEPLSTGSSVVRPWIRTRSDWGADESLRQNQDGVAYGEVRGMFVHHTATSNDYSPSDVPAILRSIYRYHVLSRDFFDIGYNFLIDKFGKIWEGAYGGFDRAVIAAHTQFYNSHSFGVAALGNFATTRPAAEVISSYRNLVAWKFAVHGIASAYATGDYTNNGAQRLPVISAHRDTKATTCPGGHLYSRLDDIRSGVHSRIARAVPLTLSGPGAVTFGARTTLEITWRDNTVAVDGLVNLQRIGPDGRWRHIRQVRVAGGRATTTVTPGATNSYRLRASSAETTGIDTRHPAGTSASHEIRVVRARDQVALTLRGPHQVESGAWTRLHVSWISPEGAVTGRVNLQRWSSSRWVHIRQLALSDGQATTVITPGSSNTYRLRASSASWPEGVPTADPEGTSNSCAVAVT